MDDIKIKQLATSIYVKNQLKNKNKNTLSAEANDTALMMTNYIIDNIKNDFPDYQIENLIEKVDTEKTLFELVDQVRKDYGKNGGLLITKTDIFVKNMVEKSQPQKSKSRKSLRP